MNNFKEKFKLYFKKRTQRISIFGLSVLIDWIFILVFGLAVATAGIVYGVFLYKDISSGINFKINSEAASTPDFQNEKLQIEKTIEYLKNR